ncbi:hypothetical protein KRR40_13735 [Niabella defluvii]|nr:hypothetical protein KRR40_13735 [Niabella sp. I65]
MKQGMVQYLQARWNLPAQSYNQEFLRQEMISRNTPAAFQTELLQLLATIDMNIYSGGGTDTDRQGLLNKAGHLLRQV